MSKEDLSAHSPSPLLGPDWNRYQHGQHAAFPGDPSTPKRIRSPPNAPSSRRQKVSEQDEGERNEQAFAEKRRVGEPGADYAATLTGEDFAHAGEVPLTGRPDDETLSPVGKPEEFLRGPVSHAGNMRMLPEAPVGARAKIGIR